MTALLPQEPSPEDRVAREVIQRLRAIAGEHFEIGAILLSRELNGKTEYFHSMIGNQFAVKGMMEAYLEGAFEPDCPSEEE
jgi:hypothetical protein